MAAACCDETGEGADLLEADRSDVVGQHLPLARTQVGDELWARLSHNTQYNVAEALGLYNSYQLVGGDNRNFATSVLALQNASLFEVDVQFAIALQLKCGYFDHVRCEKGLGSLCVLLGQLNRP
jgi:hypothetical protein